MLLIPMSILAQVGQSVSRSSAAWGIITSEITHADAKLRLQTACFATTKPGKDIDPSRDAVHVFTHVGALKDYVPHVPAKIPGVRSWVRFRVSLTSTPPAKGDDKYDAKARRRDAEKFLDSINTPRGVREDFLKSIDDRACPNFIMYLRLIGYSADPIIMYWNDSIGCYEGYLEVTGATVDSYQVEISYSFGASRERIIAHLIIWNPCINRPHTETETQKDGSELAICNGAKWTGIKDDSELWKVLIETRRATFETHEGTSWREIDTSGGYLEGDCQVPAGFVPGQVLFSGGTTPGGGGNGGQTPPAPHMLHLEIIDAVRNGTVCRAVRITCQEGYGATVTFADGRSKSSPDCTAQDRLHLVLQEYEGASKFVIKVGGANPFTQTIDFAELNGAPVGKCWDYDK
jgi:hypothetical protein